MASAAQSSNERSWKDVLRERNSPLLNAQLVAASRAAPLPRYVPFIDMGTQVERESRGEGVTGSDPRWQVGNGRRKARAVYISSASKY